MLKLCLNKNTNYRRWSKNNISLEKITSIWQRKHVDEKMRDLFDVATEVYDGAEWSMWTCWCLLIRKKLVAFVINVILD